MLNRKFALAILYFRYVFRTGAFIYPFNNPVTSDGASSLEAKDMADGNILLRGWDAFNRIFLFY